MYLSHEEHAARMEANRARANDGASVEAKQAKDAPAPAPIREKPPLRDIRILEGMAASGLRAIRYARELEDVGCVVANDLDPNAIEA